MLVSLKSRIRAAHAVGLPFLVLAVSALFVGASPARPQDLDALYAKAKSEGALALYTGGPTAPWDAAAK